MDKASTIFPDKSRAQTPTLESDRLILRPLRVEDAEDVYSKWASDPEVTQYMSWNVHKNIETTREWLQAEEIALSSPKNYDFGIVFKETGELIGSAGILYDEDVDRFGLGYILAKPYWRKGIGFEAARCIMDYAIQTLKIDRFFVYHATDNPASGAIARKLGFRYTKDSVFVSIDGSKVFPRKEYLLDIEHK